MSTFRLEHPAKAKARRRDQRRRLDALARTPEPAHLRAERDRRQARLARAARAAAQLEANR